MEIQAAIISKFASVKSASQFKQNYIMMDELGTGGFGKVWKGYRLGDSRQVAIKEIKTSQVTQWGTLNGKKVPLEVIALVGLRNCDSVIRFIDVFRASHEKIIIVMDRPRRSIDLFDYISERGRLQETGARKIFGQTLKAIIQCRSRNIFHGDIKDENILVDVETKRVRLIDFGGAMVWRDSVPYQSFLGTGLWGPPECLNKGSFTADGASSWTLGCLLFDMLSGDIPFKTKESLMEAKPAYDEFPSSEEARDLMTRTLCKEQSNRLTLDEICQHRWLTGMEHEGERRRGGVERRSEGGRKTYPDAATRSVPQQEERGAGEPGIEVHNPFTMEPKEKEALVRECQEIKASLAQNEGNWINEE